MHGHIVEGDICVGIRDDDRVGCAAVDDFSRRGDPRNWHGPREQSLPRPLVVWRGRGCKLLLIGLTLLPVRRLELLLEQRLENGGASGRAGALGAAAPSFPGRDGLDGRHLRVLGTISRRVMACVWAVADGLSASINRIIKTSDYNLWLGPFKLLSMNYCYTVPFSIAKESSCYTRMKKIGIIHGLLDERSNCCLTHR